MIIFIDISDLIEQLWSMFTHNFYFVLSKWDEIIILHPDEGVNVSLLDFAVTSLVLGVVLSVVLGIRYSIPSQDDLL